MTNSNNNTRLVIYKLPKNERVLYNLGYLLEKLCKKQKIGVFCDKEIIEMVDRELWTFSSNAFLPHNISKNSVEDNLQPVLLASNTNQIDREIICIFNNTDLFKIIDDSNSNTIKNLKDIIYMTQEEINVEDVKKSIQNITISCFEKTNNKWQKTL